MFLNLKMINLLIICLFVFSCENEEIYSGEVVGKSFLAKHFENKKRNFKHLYYSYK